MSHAPTPPDGLAAIDLGAVLDALADRIADRLAARTQAAAPPATPAPLVDKREIARLLGVSPAPATTLP